MFPIIALFAASGCAALIYEIVWLQLLVLVIGSTAVSIALLLTAYMGGLSLGSLVFPSLVSLKHHPLKVYALLELGIGIFGLVILTVVPFLRGSLSALWLVQRFVQRPAIFRGRGQHVEAQSVRRHAGRANSEVF